MPWHKKKVRVPYVPKLLPPILAPDAITWSNTPNNQARIISLLKEGKDYDQISTLTGCRLAKVRAMVRQYLQSEEDEIPATPIIEPKSQIVKAPKIKPVKVPKLPRQKINHVCYYCGTSKGRYWLRNGEIGYLCGNCYEVVQRIARGGKPRNGHDLVMINCKVCSNPFKAYQTEIAKGKKYCSTACYHKDRTILTPEQRKEHQKEARKHWIANHPEKIRDYNRKRWQKRNALRSANFEERPG